MLQVFLFGSVFRSINIIDEDDYEDRKRIDRPIITDSSQFERESLKGASPTFFLFFSFC